MSNPGIITEQGFPVGTGLGFQPLSEAEKAKLEKQFEDQDQNKENK